LIQLLAVIDWRRSVTDRSARRLSYCVVIRAKSVSDALNRQTAAADAASADRPDADDCLTMPGLAFFAKW